MVDIEGPWTLRRNDLALLRSSNINDRMRELQEDDDEEDQCSLFGDSAYKKMSHLGTYLNDTHIVAGQIGPEYRKAFNGCAKKVRISIDLDYGNTATLFPYLNNVRKLQLMKSKTITKVYTVCALLKNIHVMLYGCQTSNYFDLQIYLTTICFSKTCHQHFEQFFFFLATHRCF